MKVERIGWSEPEAPSERALRQRLRDAGYAVFRWRDVAGAHYQSHAHDHDECLWVIEGEIAFAVGGRDLCLGPGDRLLLPGGTSHSARVGAQGATYLIGERAAVPGM
jgi:mannose-6-phosphate isomerase-like protein (cupin superfamily)